MCKEYFNLFSFYIFILVDLVPKGTHTYANSRFLSIMIMTIKGYRNNEIWVKMMICVDDGFD